jgi:hypothetical protein
MSDNRRLRLQLAHIKLHSQDQEISIFRFDNREMIIATVIFVVIHFLQESISSTPFYLQCFKATPESSIFIYPVVLFNNNLVVDLG